MPESLDRILPAAPLSYEPEKWNGDAVVRKFNCYAYALDTQDHGWLPLNGRLSTTGPTLSWPRSADFNLRMPPSLKATLFLIRDGLKPIRKHEHSPTDTHIIAYDDYSEHFFRLDADGVWSHKGGKTPASNRDDRGDVITDLENAHFQFFKDLPRGSVSAHFSYYRMPVNGIPVLKESDRDILHKDWAQWPYEFRRLEEYGLMDKLQPAVDIALEKDWDKKTAERYLVACAREVILDHYDPLHFWRLIPHMKG